MMRWMIVAEPGPDCAHGEKVAREAAAAWNRGYLGERINRFWTRAGALFAIVEYHDAVWGDLIYFRIVKVRDWNRGWR
jgi:hypothetical protein